DQDVDPPELRERALGHPSAVVGAGHVGLDADGPPARGSNLLGGRLGLRERGHRIVGRRHVLPAHIREREVPPFGRQQPRYRTAEAAGRPGHQRDATNQLIHPIAPRSWSGSPNVAAVIIPVCLHHHTGVPTPSYRCAYTIATNSLDG